ncbi:hypothetical protein [Raoultibacter phocaeensis]|nr:hypothetical protein [Raoultibacter phocaeensis]
MSDWNELVREPDSLDAWPEPAVASMVLHWRHLGVEGRPKTQKVAL